MMVIEETMVRFHGRQMVKFEIDGPSIYICTVTPVKQMALEGTYHDTASLKLKQQKGVSCW